MTYQKFNFENDEKLHNPKLWCAVYEVHYDFNKRLGNLVMAKNHCCDMTACIEFFKQIDPNVQEIVTIAGTKIDTGYKLEKTGEWQAYLPSTEEPEPEPETSAN